MGKPRQQQEDMGAALQKRPLRAAPKGMRLRDFMDALKRWQGGDDQAADAPVLARYFFTVKEAARLRGVSVRTVRRRIREGRLKHRTVYEGGRRRTLVFMVPYLDRIVERAAAWDERDLPWDRIVRALLDHYGEARLKQALGMEGDYPDRGNQQLYAWIRGERPSAYYRDKLLALTDDPEADWWIGPGDV